MKIHLSYCADWSYENEAAGLAVKLLEYYKHEIQEFILEPSSGSRFEATINGVLIFSKLETNRFPEYEEIKSSIQNSHI